MCSRPGGSFPENMAGMELEELEDLEGYDDSGELDELPEEKDEESESESDWQVFPLAQTPPYCQAALELYCNGSTTASIADEGVFLLPTVAAWQVYAQTSQQRHVLMRVVTARGHTMPALSSFTHLAPSSYRLSWYHTPDDTCKLIAYINKRMETNYGWAKMQASVAKLQAASCPCPFALLTKTERVERALLWEELMRGSDKRDLMGALEEIFSLVSATVFWCGSLARMSRVISYRHLLEANSCKPSLLCLSMYVVCLSPCM